MTNSRFTFSAVDVFLSSSTSTSVVTDVEVDSKLPSVSDEKKDFFTTVLQVLNKMPFKSGKEINGALEKAYTNGDRKYVYQKSRYFQPKESLFPSYDACAIKGTSFVVTAGPQDAKEVAMLLRLIQQEGINEVIVLGREIGIDYAPGSEFVDYFTGEKRKKEKYDDFEFSIERISGQVETSGNFHVPHGILQSCLTLPNDFKVNVAFYSLPDMRFIDFDVKHIRGTKYWPNREDGVPFQQSTEERKEFFWQQFQKYLQGKKILVHCSAGLGRSGHVVFMFEILKHYHEIFIDNNDPQKAANLIHDILKRVRENRPALVFTQDQFMKAIENAHQLRAYALEKKYIQEVVPQPVISRRCGCAVM